MALWHVTLPIARHAFLSVEAESEEAAIESALEKVTFQDVDSWEAMEHFNQGNVCYCPRPWAAEAYTEDEEGDQ